MKEVMAIIRPSKWQMTKAKLLELGITCYTTSRVYGRGRQKGLHYLNRQGIKNVGVRCIPKRMIWLWLDDEQVSAIIDALMAINRTGQIGDGKIFVCPADDALRVRTGERGQVALV